MKGFGDLQVLGKPQLVHRSRTWAGRCSDGVKNLPLSQQLTDLGDENPSASVPKKIRSI
jgi:hypothetical protein